MARAVRVAGEAVKAALLALGVAGARIVLKVREAEKLGAEGVTYAWLAQELGLDIKYVKLTAHRAARAGLIDINNEERGKAKKARLSLTKAGRDACAE